MVDILIDFRVFSVMIIDILHQKVCWDGDLQEGLHFAVVYIEDLLICLVVSSALVKKKSWKTVLLSLLIQQRIPKIQLHTSQKMQSFFIAKTKLPCIIDLQFPGIN